MAEGVSDRECRDARGEVAVLERAERGFCSWTGEGKSCDRWGGDSMVGSWAITLLGLPSVVVAECWLGV